MAKTELKTIQKRAEKEIKNSKNLKDLDGVYKKYLDKQGELSQILRSLKKMSKVKRMKLGKEANELKVYLKKTIEQKNKKLKQKVRKQVYEKEWIDITIPAKKPTLGHLHPLTQVKREMENIFELMGFSIIEGPEVETEWYNFDALNVPKDHPVRDLWDTFYLKNGMLLRTHTSPVQIRYMEKNNPPFRIIVPGRIFRHEATDANHEFNFYHLEGLMIDKQISAANFKAVIEEFYRRFFKKPVKIRMRPSYFPFTEPSFEIDMTCTVCLSKGCSACGKTGWQEMMGAGMAHPNVLKNSGLNPKNWQGFAFGMGVERLVMMKYKINDIRFLYKNDLRFLKQF
ncbi:MAG: phenylalanine--tRNA ligase subunit alpha [Patescibacteria group bacterium]|nr:phenylalanine--tRNA ligase subunit alpha [Patescibacteria group bacterium]